VVAPPLPVIHKPVMESEWKGPSPAIMRADIETMRPFMPDLALRAWTGKVWLLRAVRARARLG
jgi:hypothetical protein